MTNLLADWQPAPAGYKHVVSVSIGSSKRDAREELEVLGQRFVLERLGTDGDMKKAGELFSALDGRVDAFGLGGADLFIVAGERRYKFKDIEKLVAHARQTPVLDGSGLKHTLEREAVRQLDPQLHWRGEKVLMVAAVDRFGMAEALADAGADVIYGDAVFSLNVNYPVRSIGALRGIAQTILPVITRLPFVWFYPTGEKQDQSVQGPGTKYYDWAQVIAGDFLFIKRYAPSKLAGKVILTNTTTAADLEWARQAGVAQLITTTPRVGTRSFGTNVMEAFMVALSGQGHALSEREYLDYARQLDFQPQVNTLH